MLASAILQRVIVTPTATEVRGATALAGSFADAGLLLPADLACEDIDASDIDTSTATAEIFQTIRGQPALVQLITPVFDWKAAVPLWTPFINVPAVALRPYLVSASAIITDHAGSSYTLGPTMRIGFANAGVFADRLSTDLAIAVGSLNAITGVPSPIRSSTFAASVNVRPIPLLTDFAEMGVDLSVAATGPQSLAGYVELVLAFLPP